MVKDATSKAPSGRVKRKSVGTRDRLLIINKDPGREYRLISSDPARIYEMEQLGYRIEKVADYVPKGLRTDQSGIMDNALPVGIGRTHVLVSIDKDEYLEAQKDKAEEVDRTEAAIKPNISDGQYGKVTISK